MPHRLQVAMLLSLALAIPAAAMPANDVIHLDNPAMPRDGAVDVQLEELWRVGGDDDDLILGLVTQVRQDRNGDLYVMDAQLSCVHVFSEDGEYLRTIFGEGEGPGEIRGPRDFVLLDDGRVGAVQEVPGKLVFVDRQGVPAGQLEIGGSGVGHGGFCQTFSAFTNGTTLLVAGFIQKPGQPGHLQQTSFLSRVDAEGRLVTDLARVDNDIEFATFVFDETRHLAPFWWNAAVAPDGRIYVAPDLLRYEINVFQPDGTAERVITRDQEPWPRTQADKDRFVEMVQAVYHGMPVEVQVAPVDHEPTVAYLHRGLRVHPDGSLWVLTSRGIREPGAGAMATFDVFDPDGEFDRQVNVHGDWDARHDGVFFLADDRAVVVTGFADAMLTQFTGGNMTLDLAGDAGSVEVIVCRVR